MFLWVTEHIGAFLVFVVFLESWCAPPKQPSAWLLKRLIRLYQVAISPHVTSQCRFQPTCSHYGYGSLERFGSLRGSLLILWRLLRCHPFSRGGNDPVPLAKDRSR